MTAYAWWVIGVVGLFGSAWACAQCDVWWRRRQADVERQRVADCLERLQKEVQR